MEKQLQKKINTYIAQHTPTFAIKALEILENAGHEAWFVGGFVRDCINGYILSKQTSSAYDIDIATSATWQASNQAFQKAGWTTIETGTKHGTISVLPPKDETFNSNNSVESSRIEVTTYRSETTYSDGRHPDKVTFVKSIKEDLQRRDFTMNAIAWHPKRNLFDPFKGEDDIINQTIRAVGNPYIRFEEDALRVLRCTRFVAQLDFNVEPETHIDVLRAKYMLKNISAERIRDELTKLICGPYAYKALMRYKSIIAVCIPELSACIGFDQKTKYHCYDVYEHTAWVVQRMPIDKYVPAYGKNEGQHATIIGRWAALLHDIGKPEVFFVGENGQGHFYGHPKVSARLAKQILKKLKFSKSDRKKICLLVKLHDHPTATTTKSVRKMLKRIAERSKEEDTLSLFRILCDLRRSDTLAHAEPYCKKTTDIDEIEKVFENIISTNTVFSINQLAINGYTLIHLGVEPGPKINEILQNTLNAVIAEQVPNSHDALIKYVKKYI